MLLGASGVVVALFELIGAGDNIAMWGADETAYSFWFYVSPLLGIASSGLFVYAGFLLWNYKKKGVWMGFGAVGINVVDGVLASIIVGLDRRRLAMLDGAGGFLASLGLAATAISAVCCGLIVALPLLMNGNDLDDD